MWTRTATILAVALLLAACSGYQPKRFTSFDDDRDLPPGLFTGEDGVYRIGLGDLRTRDRESQADDRRDRPPRRN